MKSKYWHITNGEHFEDCYCEVDPPCNVEDVKRALCDLVADIEPVSEQEYKDNTDDE